MLALASLLVRLRDDPGTVGKRYELVARLPPEDAGAVRGDPRRGGRRAALRDGRRRLVPARRAAAADRLSGRPHALRGAAARGRPAAADATARRRSASGSPTRSACGPGRRSPSRLPGGDGGALPRVRRRAGAGERRPARLRAPRPAPRRRPGARLRASRSGSRRAPTASGSCDAAEPRSARRRRGRRARRPPATPRFLGVLAGVLRGVGLAVGLVCLYALVQALAMTARERRGAVALLRACGRRRRRGRGGAGRRGRSPSPCRRRSPASRCEALVLGPLVARLGRRLRRPAARAPARVRSRSWPAGWRRSRRRPPPSSRGAAMREPVVAGLREE